VKGTTAFYYPAPVQGPEVAAMYAVLRKNLVDEMESRNWKFPDLTKRARIGYAALRRFMTEDTKTMPLHTALSIAKAFEIPLEQLLEPRR